MASGLPQRPASDAVAPPPLSGGRSATTVTAHERPVAVLIDGVSKSFGAVKAVRSVSLSLREGTLTSLLGPSGCGKTTLLRLIAGLETTSTGGIEIKGRPVGGLPIHKRNIGLVFQNYALFPHKTVGENIAFGLKHHGVDKTVSAEKVKRALEMVRLPGIEQRYPNQLSGGQQQRVALARAVVFEPDVLLLDEPLSALDANLREEMRIEIKLIQKALGLTTILVTHDQQEALAMSDEIVVMNQGSVQQIGDPKTVYRFPQNRFVAGFLGQANVLECIVGEPLPDNSGRWRVVLPNGVALLGVPGGPGGKLKPQSGAKADLVIRGSDVTVRPGSAAAKEDFNGFEGVIIDSSYLGDDAHYLIDCAGTKFKAVSRITHAEAGEAGAVLAAGTHVRISVPAEACAILQAS